QANQNNRERVWRLPAVGVDRPSHARPLHGVARQARQEFTATGRLCLDRAGAGSRLGAQPWPDRGKSLREGRAALSRRTRRQDLDRRRRNALPATCTRTSASAAIARLVDWAAARRSLASAVVGL